MRSLRVVSTAEREGKGGEAIVEEVAGGENKGREPERDYNSLSCISVGVRGWR